MLHDDGDAIDSGSRIAKRSESATWPAPISQRFQVTELTTVSSDNEIRGFVVRNTSQILGLTKVRWTWPPSKSDQVPQREKLPWQPHLQGVVCRRVRKKPTARQNCSPWLPQETRNSGDSTPTTLTGPCRPRRRPRPDSVPSVCPHGGAHGRR